MNKYIGRIVESVRESRDKYAVAAFALFVTVAVTAGNSHEETPDLKPSPTPVLVAAHDTVDEIADRVCSSDNHEAGVKFIMRVNSIPESELSNLLPTQSLIVPENC